jgi:hypothetical protein
MQNGEKQEPLFLNPVKPRTKKGNRDWKTCCSMYKWCIENSKQLVMHAYLCIHNENSLGYFTRKQHYSVTNSVFVKMNSRYSCIFFYTISDDLCTGPAGYRYVPEQFCEKTCHKIIYMMTSSNSSLYTWPNACYVLCNLVNMGTSKSTSVHSSKETS